MMDELIRIIPYLKYGVAFMLVFIGTKLILSKVIHINSLIVCGVLCGTLFLCMLGGWYATSLKKSPDFPDKVAESRASPVLHRTTPKKDHSTDDVFGATRPSV